VLGIDHWDDFYLKYASYKICMCKTSTHQLRMHISKVEEMADLRTGKMTWTIFSEEIRCKQARNKYMPVLHEK
jgi:hypothetical protein